MAKDVELTDEEMAEIRRTAETLDNLFRSVMDDIIGTVMLPQPPKPNSNVRHVVAKLEHPVCRINHKQHDESCYVRQSKVHTYPNTKREVKNISGRVVVMERRKLEPGE